MLRGYRSLGFAAALACLLIVFGIGLFIGTLNYPDEQRHQEYRYTDKDITDTKIAARPDLPETKEYKAPCDRPYGKDESDLCAQWRAAKAAENSAFWAKWGIWIAVIGSSLLMWQIMLTREAVKDTGEATKAMNVANEIAKAAQRPWVSIEVNPKIMQRDNGTINYQCEIFFKNIGLTVAKNFLFKYEIVFILPDKLDTDSAQWKKWFEPIDKSNSVLMPSEAFGQLASRFFKMTDIAWLDMGSTSPRVMMPVIAVSAFYQAADGDGWHRTDRAFRIGKRGSDSDCLAIEETVSRLKPPDLTTAPYGLPLAT